MSSISKLKPPPAARRSEAPEHLSDATREWWLAIVGEYDLEPHHIRLLTLAAEAWDRCQQARQAIAEHGITYTDQTGAPRARPEVAIERDARLAFARLLRELALDVSAPPESRPPAITGRR